MIKHFIFTSVFLSLTTTLTHALPVLPKPWWATDVTNLEGQSEKGNQPSAEVTEALFTQINSASNILNQSKIPQAKGFQLDQFSLGLGVSLHGVLAGLSSKGYPAVILKWHPKAATTLEKNEMRHPEILLHENMSDEEIDATFKPLVRSAKKVASIKDNLKFYQKLRESAREFMAAAVALNELPARRWDVERLEMDHALGAEATVTPIKASLNLIFTLVWQVPAQRHASLDAVKNLKAADIIKFATATAEDLESLEQESVPAGFGLDQVSIGIGRGVRANLFVAKFESLTVGHLIMKRHAERPPERAFDKESRKDKIRDDIKVVVKDPWLNKSEVMIKRDEFKKGIQSALKMGRFITGIVQKVPTFNWKLDQVETAMTMNAAPFWNFYPIQDQGAIHFFYNKEL